MKQLIKSFGFFLSVCWDTFKVFYGKSNFYRDYGIVSVQFLTRTQITEMRAEHENYMAEIVAETAQNLSLGKDKTTRLN